MYGMKNKKSVCTEACVEKMVIRQLVRLNYRIKNTIELAQMEPITKILRQITIELSRPGWNSLFIFGVERAAKVFDCVHEYMYYDLLRVLKWAFKKETAYGFLFSFIYE